MKIAVIGAGSTYTPELVSGLSRERDRIDVSELVLHDIDAERRDVVGGLAQRMLERQGFDGRLEVTGELERAVDGADFVLIQIRVGGQAARLSDETLPLACGCIGQETTGAGGLGKALRTVPVVLGIADEVRRRAADGAWIVDFTNPVGIVTRALLDAGHRAIGLCNVAINFQRHAAQLLGVEPGAVEIDQVGLNHLSWVRFVRLYGEDVLPELIAEHGDELAEGSGVPRRVLEELGVWPSYYLHYFYRHDEVFNEQLDGVPRAATVAQIERELLEMYRDPALVEKPPLLEQRGGAYYSEAAIGLVGSLAGDNGEVHVVDIRNDGTVGGLAADDVVEVPARVRSGGTTALPQPPVAPELLGLMQHVTAYERLAARAAITGDRVLVHKALLAHPLIGQLSMADELVDRLLADGAAHLPQFRRSSARTTPAVLAVDGGNSKTDLALLGPDGAVLALVRGPLSSPHHLGVEGSLSVLAGLLQSAQEDAGINGEVADVAELLMAGVDFPAEEETLREVVTKRGWARSVHVGNDTFAVLRAGTERGWGVAVTCGAGINCVGVAPDGRHARFPALGAITGDWGGGYDLGLAAVSAAARSEDGRGPRTTLESAVPGHFGLATPTELAEAIHVGTIEQRRVIELAPLVLAEATADTVASEIVQRLVSEVVALVRVALTRLDLKDQPVEVLLGGGVLQDVDGDLLDAIDAGLRESAPHVHVRPTASPAIVGAALLGLDQLGLDGQAQSRARRELGIAFSQLEGVATVG